jgi:hypothetical protein
MVKRFNDADLRQAIHRRLLARVRRRPDTLVINELGLQHGAARIDIAVINGYIRGLEIKAETDTLTRLPRQVEIYGHVVDKATLIVAERHIEAALVQLPEWWGLILAHQTRNGSISFRHLRPERINRGVDPMTLVRLMWRSEVIGVLQRLGYKEKMLRGPRVVLYNALVAQLSLGQLAGVVRTALKTRTNWRDRSRLSLDDGSSRPSAMY